MTNGVEDNLSVVRLNLAIPDLSPDPLLSVDDWQRDFVLRHEYVRALWPLLIDWDRKNGAGRRRNVRRRIGRRIGRRWRRRISYRTLASSIRRRRCTRRWRRVMRIRLAVTGIDDGRIPVRRLVFRIIPSHALYNLADGDVEGGIH